MISGSYLDEYSLWHVGSLAIQVTSAYVPRLVECWPDSGARLAGRSSDQGLGLLEPEDMKFWAMREGVHK